MADQDLQHTKYYLTQRCVYSFLYLKYSLMSHQKRQIYDRYGEEGLKAHEGGQAPRTVIWARKQR